jgi:hypothetical protein
VPDDITADLASIANQIIAQATTIGGETWTKIQKSAPLYIRGYSQNLLDIAAGVLANEITKADAKLYLQNARLLLVQGIANTAQIMLVQVQKFIDSVLNIVKGAINTSLKVAIL